MEVRFNWITESLYSPKTVILVTTLGALFLAMILFPGTARMGEISRRGELWESLSWRYKFAWGFAAILGMATALVLNHWLGTPPG